MNPPDLAQGIPAGDVADDGMLLGKVGEDKVLLVRKGDQWFAVGAECSHYHGALAEGLVVNDTIRCPLHHACFSLETGEALRAPALAAIPRWRVEVQAETVFVREKLEAHERARAASTAGSPLPDSIIIIGGGAAGLAAADMLRREGYEGPVTMLSADQDPPVDRPNLSKDFLAGEAQDDWMPLWPPERFAERKIDLVLQARAVSIDAASRSVALADGSRRTYGALLLATGADPVRLPMPGLSYLRSYADSRAIVEKAKTAKHAVVIGASFIGLEVAASLRARGVAVDVVAPDQVPLQRVMGPEVGRFVQSLHEARGVVFHFGRQVTAIEGRTVRLSDGGTLDADLVVAGIGVKPATALAESAGLAIDRGISVNEYLETSVPGIFAAGDTARWPDPHTGERLRVEHWVVAERQGQTAARNMLGRRERFEAVPFFWSKHYDVTINYVGHAERWDGIDIDGTLGGESCSVTYVQAGRPLAVATISRDLASLEAEVRFEGTLG